MTQPRPSPNRRRAAQLGQEAVLISRTGTYAPPSGRTVDLRREIDAAVAGTVAYPPNTRLPDPPLGRRTPRFEVTNETTLAAGRRLSNDGARVCALNFASARH